MARAMRVRAALLGGIVALAVAAAACGGGGAAAPPSAGPTIAGTDLPASPTALPTFDLAAFRRALSDLKGTPVLVNFWASWCGPCTKEAPDLAAAAARYRGKVQFVGVDVDDAPAAARAFIHRYGWTYPSVADPSAAIRNGMGYVGQPVTVLFDANGRQVKVWAGATDPASLDQALAAVAA